MFYRIVVLMGKEINIFTYWETLQSPSCLLYLA